jgi:hypothetical protein
LSEKHDYICGFCLSEYKDLREPPEACYLCQVYKCTRCCTWLKGPNPNFCYGCGTVKPSVRASFVGTHETAVHFVYESWHARNRGNPAPGGYRVAVGSWQDQAITGKGRPPVWISRIVRTDNGMSTRLLDIRLLTSKQLTQLQDQGVGCE